MEWWRVNMNTVSMRRHSLLLVMLCWWSVSVLATDEDGSSFRTVLWRGVPLSMSMAVGQEKILAFSEDVQWSVPRELIGIVRGEAMAGKVYLSTETPFDKARFRFRGIDSNRHYVIDLSASEQGQAGAVRIRLEEPEAAVSGNAASTASGERPSGIPQLTRYAFQSVYAPERLIDRPRDVADARLVRVDALEHLLVGHRVLARPLAQWRSESGDYAIAISLENQESRTITLDPRRMRRSDRWLSLAMINDRLGPRGSRHDRTTIVIVADGRWSEVSEWLR